MYGIRTISGPLSVQQCFNNLQEVGEARRMQAQWPNLLITTRQHGDVLHAFFFWQRKQIRPDNSILAYYFFSTAKEGIPFLNSTDTVHYID